MDDLLAYCGPAAGAALVLAGIDWLAVARGWRQVEYVFKPATLIAIFAGAWLLTRGPHDAWQASFFLPGLVFSLAGDTFLMVRGQRFFVFGLASFLLAHVCYIIGMNPTQLHWPALALLGAVAAIGLILHRAIAAGLRRRGQTKLLLPATAYTVILSLMLFAAWATLFKPEWTPMRRGMIIAGASLFFISDAMLAWERFVSPSPSARLRVMITYHLGQMALAGSLALWG